MTLEFCYTGEVRFEGTRVVLTHVGSSVAYSANVAPEFARIADGIAAMCRYYGAGRTVVWSGRESDMLGGWVSLRNGAPVSGAHYYDVPRAVNGIEAFCCEVGRKPHAPCPFCGIADGLQLAMGIRAPFVRCDLCSVSGPDGGWETWNRRP